MRGMRGLSTAWSSLALLALVGVGPACNRMADDFFCADDSCEWSKDEWNRVAALSPLGEPPADPSNRVSDERNAVLLGWRLYYDTSLSGPATLRDMLGRPVPSARAPLGQPTRISCATCHDPAHGGGDVTSAPGHVSVGAGWYDVNGQQTLNAAHYKLLYWNGRSDSLWGQAAAVMESPVSMNGNRLDILWTVSEKYANEFAGVFSGNPALPMTGPRPDVAACAAATAPACPDGCRMVTADSGATACHPRFPLQGKPGRAGCQFDVATEPFGDAFDCMAMEDRAAVNRAYAAVAKAIGAYERKLTSRNAPFDDFVAEGPGSKTLSPEARRGLKLFVGRASCIDCHNTPLFSDNKFHNIGVPQTGAGVPTEADCRGGSCDCTSGRADNAICLPWGFADGLSRLNFASHSYRRNGGLSDDASMAWKDTHADYYDKKGTEAMRGKWRTPSLRDCQLSGPYMHNGIYRTLEEVVWHYDVGGEGGDFGTKAPELKPLFLTARDRLDLVAFLRTLSGKPDCPELHLPYAGKDPQCQ
jgi:cytochrome c peroxidase